MMIKKPVFPIPLLSGVILLLLFLGAAAQAAVSTDNYSADMVEGVIEDLISTSGTPDMEIIGQGSYIKKGGFRDPLLGGSSDFDMRLRLKNANVSPEEAARRWVEVQNRIRQTVQKKFGNMTFIVNGKPVNAAKAILQKINVYPPQQMMKGVTSKAEAFALFKKYGVVPNLGYEAGSIADDVLEEAAEGIWGSGAVIQEMEKGARGKRWFTDGTTNQDGTKRVLTGSPGEIHAEEGIGGITAQERANVAKQVAEKTSSALGSDPALVKKNLIRLQRYLKQAKLLAGVKPSANDAMIDQLVKELEKLEGEALEKAIASKAGAIERALLDAWTDAHLLGQIATKRGAMNRALYGGMLESSGKWASVRGLLNDKEFRAFAKRQAFVAAIVLVWEAPELYRRASKEGVASAAIYASATLIAAAMPLSAHLISMAAMWIAEAMVDYVGGYGYEAIIKTQDCQDLLAGLYTVYGREAQVFKERLPRPSIEVQDLRAYYCRNARISDTQMSVNLSTLVQAHAENACTRYDDYESMTDANAAAALYNKCFPALLQRLMLEKQSAAYEVRALLQQLKGLAVDPYYDRADAVLVKGRATVRVMAPFRADPKTLEKDLTDILRCLGGRNRDPGVLYRYRWYAGQEKAGDKARETTDGKNNSHSFTFDKVGRHQVCVALETDLTGISFELFRELDDIRVSRDPVCIDVVIREEGTPVDQKKTDEKVGGKPGDDIKDDKIGAPPTQEVKNDGKQQTPQVQPTDYTKGQIGSPEGQDKTAGQAGLTAGVTGQTGTTQTGPAKTSSTTTTAGTPGKADTTAGTSSGKDTSAGVQTGVTSGVGTAVGIGQETTPPTKTIQEPPACTYEYSAWGDCSRVTQKQTRTVVAKKPEGCVERGKPNLEQGCTPPPTEEEKRNGYLNCLCRCYTHWAGHIGVFYAPSGYQECHGSGPCVGGIGAFGDCDRSFYGTQNDCAKVCYEGAYGKGSYDEQTADAIAKGENRKFKKPLQLKLETEKCPITVQLGDIVNLKVSLEGGIPPYTFSWSGNGMAKDNTFTFANTRQPGNYPVSVTATDSDHGSVTANCDVLVDAVSVEIEKTSPPGNTLPVGGKASFRAVVKSGKNVASGDLKFLWQPHPEVQFGDEKHPLFETSSPTTTATYTRPGSFPMWVQVLKKIGDTHQTIGESEQIPMTVVEPVLKLSVDKKSPRIGEKVAVTVQEDPKMEDSAIAFWWEIRGETAYPGPEPNVPNSRAYSFKPKDSKPVTVTVHGKAKDGGDELGQASATITAQPYEVSIGGPQRRGPKPKIWKTPEWKQGVGLQGDFGLVEVADHQFAVFEDIFVKADVKPSPEKLPIRYSWTITPSGSCGIPGAGQELRLNCSQTGTYTVSLTARDSENLILGKASRPVTVTVSQADLDKAKKPRVALQADRPSLKTGETTVIWATVQGGKTPYTYRWSGVEGKADQAQFSPTKSGAQKITVEVTDGAGNKASANLSLKVERGKLEVALKSAKTGLLFGETVEIRAEVKGGEAPFTYTWGPGRSGKKDTFPFAARKGGAQRVFVEVTDKTRRKAKASIEMTVEVPKLEVTLKADKTTLKLGETVVIQTFAKGGVPPLTSKWGAGVDAQGETAHFSPKKSGPYKAVVEVTDSAKQSVNASLDLQVEAPKLEVSLKADQKTLMLGERVTLQAGIKGGEAPYVIQWGSGAEGKGETAWFVAEQSGAQKASVTVSDRSGQKASATIDLKIEIPKLEAALEADRPVLKVGERGTVQAKVKGGMPEYRYQWSSFLSGMGEKATFLPRKAGLYKVWLEVRDKAGGKVTASLDWKVEAGEDGASQVGDREKIAIEPENLTLAVGETQTLKVMQILPDGRKMAHTKGRVFWSGAPAQGIVISDQGQIQATSLAKTGARVKITAKVGFTTAEGWVAVVPASKTAKPPTVRVEPPVAVTTTVLAAPKPTSLVTTTVPTTALAGHAPTTTVAPSGYDPTADPAAHTGSVKNVDLEKVNKIAADFQKGQWAAQAQKEQKVKDQPPGQAIPPDYLSSSTTSVTTTIPPGGTTTIVTTTAPQGVTTTSIGQSGKTAKDLTDVTVGRRDVTITVWDHGTEDGDIINIYLNGKRLKSNLRLTKNKQVFRVNLIGGQNRFDVEAVNEGSQSPNTATVEISNVTQGKPNQVYERKSGQKASMNLNAP